MNVFPRMTSTGQVIFVIDDLFTPHEHLMFQRNAQKLQWHFITPGTLVVEHQKDVCLAKMFDDWEGETVGLTRSKNFDIVLKIAGKERAPTRCWVNLVHIGAESYFHPDGFEDSDLTFLYYMNSEWGLNFGGETIFCDIAGEPDLAVRAKPNRGVLFPSKLLHRITAPSRHAPPWRYSFVMQFSKVEDGSDLSDAE